MECALLSVVDYGGICQDGTRIDLRVKTNTPSTYLICGGCLFWWGLEEDGEDECCENTKTKDSDCNVNVLRGDNGVIHNFLRCSQAVFPSLRY